MKWFTMVVVAYVIITSLPRGLTGENLTVGVLCLLCGYLAFGFLELFKFIYRWIRRRYGKDEEVSEVWEADEEGA